MLRADNRVRVTAHLIDATTGRHLWAERYDRDLKDAFALQDDIAECRGYSIIATTSVFTYRAKPGRRVVAALL